MKNRAQLDLFVAPTPRSPLAGLAVRLPDVCHCGSGVAKIGSPVGPHLAELYCARCERHRGWLPRTAHEFLTEVVNNFGRPTEPIAIRRGRSELPEITFPVTEVVMEKSDLEKLKQYAAATRSSLAFSGCTYIQWDWKTGKYPVGKNKTDFTNKKLAADVPDAMRGFQHLEKGQKPEYALTRVLDSSVEPIERNELNRTDKSHWIDGKDPWVGITAMPFFDPETRQSFILIAAYGGRAEMSALIDTSVNHMTQHPEAADQRPLVQLCVREYIKADGTSGYAMQLDVVGWIDRPEAVLHIQPPPLSILEVVPKAKSAESAPTESTPTESGDKPKVPAKPQRKIVAGGKTDIDDEIPF